MKNYKETKYYNEDNSECLEKRKFSASYKDINAVAVLFDKFANVINRYIQAQELEVERLKLRLEAEKLKQKNIKNKDK